MGRWSTGADRRRLHADATCGTHLAARAARHRCRVRRVARVEAETRTPVVSRSDTVSGGGESESSDRAA